MKASRQRQLADSCRHRRWGGKTVSARATLAAMVVFWAVANGLLLLRFSW